MYEIRTAGSKGLGVFANRLIPRGTRIFSERPLLAIRAGQDASDIYPQARRLSANDRERLMGLSAHVTNELSVLRWNQAIWYTVQRICSDLTSRARGSLPKRTRGSIWDHVAVLSIFRSNSFNLGSRDYQQALFPEISRVNHSCIPNAQGNFHEGQGKFNVHATRDIVAGEEISLSYLHEHGAMRETRQNRLLEGYGFICDCPACDLNSLRGLEGEHSRGAMLVVLKHHAEASPATPRSVSKEIAIVKQYLELLKEQGIAGRELSTLYMELAKLHEEDGTIGEALVSAEKGLEVEEDCLGTDHELYQQTLRIVQALRLKA